MSNLLAATAVAIGASDATSLLVTVTFTLVLALVAASCLRTARAAVRHVLLAVAFAVLLVLPVASIAIPARVVEIPIGAATQSEAPALAIPMFPEPPRVPAAGPERGGIDTTPGSSVSWPVLLTMAWAVGVLLTLCPIIAWTWQARSLRQSASPWHDEDSSVRALALEAGVHRSIELRVHHTIPGPMTYGVVRPVILLPVDAGSWTDEELRRALIHEIEHIRRRDWLTQYAARIVCAIYWFHPLVWVAWHRLRLEAERACDDAVLRRAEATAYASQLVMLAERLSKAATPPLVAMAACRDLPTRVRAVLDHAQRRGRAGALSVATVCVIGAALVAFVAPLRAVPQERPSAPPAVQDAALAFDAASVRPNNSPVDMDESFLTTDPGGTLRVVNYPLRMLILWAYDLQSFQLEGPDWMMSSRFDIIAKPGPISAPAASDGPRPAQLMLRTLLADRFRLAVHKETKELPIYELVLARRDGKPGPQLRAAAADCAAMRAAINAGTFTGPSVPPGPGGCGTSIRFGLIRFGGLPLASFGQSLSRLTGRVVVDRSGLPGNWEFELTFAPDPTELQLPPGMPPPPPPAAIDPNAPSLFTALQDQLGLRLQPARGPVEVLVVDHVETASPN